MAEKLIITEHGKPDPPYLQAPTKEPLLDLQDGLVLGGCALLVAGILAIYWPAALITAGLLALTFAYLIERSKRANGTRKP